MLDVLLVRTSPAGIELLALNHTLGTERAIGSEEFHCTTLLGFHPGFPFCHARIIAEMDFNATEKLTE
jgi:hypothetical protein